MIRIRRRPVRRYLQQRIAELEAHNRKLAGDTDHRLAQLRHVIDEQAHRIQSGHDRIAQLETERDNDLCVMVAFLKPNARGEAAWTAILANHFGPRAQELVEDTARFAAAYSRVNQLPPVAAEPDDTAGSAT